MTYSVYSLERIAVSSYPQAQLRLIKTGKDIPQHVVKCQGMLSSICRGFQAFSGQWMPCRPDFCVWKSLYHGRANARLSVNGARISRTGSFT